MLFPNSCRCSVGGETFRLSSQSSRFRYPYSAPLFFFSFFFFSFSFSPWEVVSYVCMFLFFATHHPPVITTCSWGSVGHFRPWTHTSDDSYIYQLSLVVATATVSYNLLHGNQSNRLDYTGLIIPGTWYVDISCNGAKMYLVPGIFCFSDLCAEY